MKPLRLVIFSSVVAIMLYVGAYFVAVDEALRVPVVGHADPTSDRVAIPEYFGCTGSVWDPFFWPIHQLDRQVRSELWTVSLRNDRVIHVKSRGEGVSTHSWVRPSGFVGPAHEPCMLTILCSQETTGGRVVVMDLHDAEQVEAQEGRWTIVNLTAQLIVAETLLLEHVSAASGERIRITLSGGIVDTIPCFTSFNGGTSDGVAALSCYSRWVEPSELLRVNGKVMQAIQAARAFARLPPDS